MYCIISIFYIELLQTAVDEICMGAGPETFDHLMSVTLKFLPLDIRRKV